METFPGARPRRNGRPARPSPGLRRVRPQRQRRPTGRPLRSNECESGAKSANARDYRPDWLCRANRGVLLASSGRGSGRPFTDHLARISLGSRRRSGATCHRWEL